MKVREHSRVKWPPLLRSQHPPFDAPLEPVSEDQPILREVYRVREEAVTFSCNYEGQLLDYFLQVKGTDFAEKLGATLANHIGKTLRELGSLEINY